MPPADVATHLIGRIESPALDEALGQAQSHRRVVGPLARPKAERPAADHLGDWLEAPFRAEFEGRAERVTDGEPDEAADITIKLWFHSVLQHFSVGGYAARLLNEFSAVQFA